MSRGTDTILTRAAQGAGSRGETRARIVAAAEHVFARDGLAAASLRTITERAGVNLAAVNYHFGSKEALTLAVFDTLSERVNSRRTNDLRAILWRAGQDGRLPDLEEIVRCFIRPYIDPEPGESSRLMAQLVLQHRIAPSPVTTEIIRRHFDPMAEAFVGALAKARPGVPRASLYWRYMFMTGAVVMTATDQTARNRLSRLSGGSADMLDRQAAASELVRFLVGAIKA